MRYPTRAYQPDTTVVSNDRHRRHQASQKESLLALTGAAFPTYLTNVPTYQVLGSRGICNVAALWI